MVTCLRLEAFLKAVLVPDPNSEVVGDLQGSGMKRSRLESPGTVDGKNPANQLRFGSFSHCLQGFSTIPGLQKSRGFLVAINSMLFFWLRCQEFVEDVCHEQGEPVSFQIQVGLPVSMDETSMFETSKPRKNCMTGDVER